MCVCVLNLRAAAEISRKKKRESREQRKERAERKKHFSIFGFQKPVAENIRFPEIERSDRLDILAAPSQQLDERFGRLDRGFEVWRSGFRAVLHSSVFGDIFLIFCYILVPYILMCLFPSGW